MAFAPPARHLLRAKDLADARYFEPLEVGDLAAAAGLSKTHFSREFRRTFGESPYVYLLTRRLERAAALLRDTDRSRLRPPATPHDSRRQPIGPDLASARTIRPRRNTCGTSTTSPALTTSRGSF